MKKSASLSVQLRSVAFLALFSSSVLAGEESAISNSAWGLSVQRFGTSGMDLRYKSESTAWLVNVYLNGADIRRTRPDSSGSDITNISRNRYYGLGLAWRKYFSSEPVRFFAQPEIEWHVQLYDGTNNVSDIDSDTAYSNKTRGYGVQLKTGAELFLADNVSIEGYAGLAYRSDTTSDARTSNFERRPDPDDYRKYFSTYASLAATLYWERSK